MGFVKLAVLTICLATTIAGIPWKAEPRPEDWWVERHAGYKQNSAINGANVTVLFYGDSITEGWGGAGSEIYNSKYAPLGAANYGIDGDRTEHLLYRIGDVETDGLNPKLIVLKIGINNGGDITDNVVRGIWAVCDLLRSKMPNSKILLLGILPRTDAGAFAWVADINIKISKGRVASRVVRMDGP